jgi:D-alanyl-D-alanine carboxypeptidase (penicillin-binding protein 5/6)
LIFRAGLTVPQFVYYLGLKTAQFPAPKGQSFQIQTHDRLLTSYAGMLGGKNGYTVAANASYVGAAKRDGHTIIVSVMRDQANFWPEVQALLNWGFAADGHVTPVGELVKPLEPASPVEPSPTASVQPAVQALTATAAPAPAAAVAKTAPKASSNTTSDGVGISAVMIWSAVGVGALFFLGAAWRFTRRRRIGDTDGRYLDGLSRLSSVDDLASK